MAIKEKENFLGGFFFTYQPQQIYNASLDNWIAATVTE